MSIEKCEICGVEAFMRCEKHNRCDDCGFTKEESNKKNTHLVHREGGLFCDPCWKIKMDKRVKEFSGDTECTGEITCPYCGSENSDSWELIDSDGIEIDCDVCDNKFSLSVNQSVDFTTSKITRKTGFSKGGKDGK